MGSCTIRRHDGSPTGVSLLGVSPTGPWFATWRFVISAPAIYHCIRIDLWCFTSCVLLLLLLLLMTFTQLFASFLNGMWFKKLQTSLSGRSSGAAVRWSRVAYAARGTNYHTWLPSSLCGRLTDSERYSRRLTSVLLYPFLPLSMTIWIMHAQHFCRRFQHDAVEDCGSFHFILFVYSIRRRYATGKR